MNKVLTGQSDKLRNWIVRAAEGPVILLLLLAVSFLLSGLSKGLPFSETLPDRKMISELCSLARPLAVGGTFCFLIVWFSLLTRPPGKTFSQNRLLTNGSFLFAAASFLSLYSSRQEVLWCFRYLLLFSAYLLCSLFLLNSCRDAVKELLKNREELEKRKKKSAEILARSQKKRLAASGFFLPSCGQETGGIGYIQADITAHKELEYQLQLDRKILENTEEAVVITDVDALIVDINTAYTRITGYKPQEIIGENPRVCQSGHHDKAFYEAMWKELLEIGEWAGEIWDRRKNGELYRKWLTINAVYDKAGNTINYIGIFADITEKRKVERQLKELLFYDPLTKLPNRTLFEELLTQALLNSQFHDDPLILLCLDLHRFKDINDTLGYKAGDDLLIQVSKRIRTCIRETDTVSRLCGDEFMVLLSEVKLTDCVGHLARRLLHVLQQPFHIAGEEVFIDACIGISVYPEDGRDAEILIRNADTAMNFAQKKGPGNYQYFRARMNENLLHRVTVERELRQALEHEGFILYYQPKYNLATGEISGAEALMRWRHPAKGIISPAEFIPVAEESSLILALGEWGLREACHQVKIWQEQGAGELPMAVNLSAKQFQDERLLPLVCEVLAENNIPPESLELEITESALMEEPDKAVQLIKDIRYLGVRIAIDDFGTGYSSLAYLKSFPVNTLKIDQVFIRDIVRDRNDAAIVTSVLSMAESMGLKVVAEGVETEGQLDVLKKMGCEEVQGYYFTKPLPPEGVAELLKRSSSC